MGGREPSLLHVHPGADHCSDLADHPLHAQRAEPPSNQSNRLIVFRRDPMRRPAGPPTRRPTDPLADRPAGPSAHRCAGPLHVRVLDSTSSLSMMDAAVKIYITQSSVYLDVRSEEGQVWEMRMAALTAKV